VNELLQTQVKSLKMVVADADVKQMSTGQNFDRQRQLNEISEMKQQVI